MYCNKVVDFSKLKEFQHESGIYFRSDTIKGNKEDLLDLREYVDMSTQLYSLSKFCACFSNIPHLKPLYNTLTPQQRISIQTLIPVSYPDAMSWISRLAGKRILVITAEAPRVIQRIQYETSHPNQTSHPMSTFIQQSTFIVYSGYNCFHGNKPHTSWKYTFQQMCEDIQDKEFDVALVAFGGYNYPLCHYIFTTLNRTVIQLGYDIREWF